MFCIFAATHHQMELSVRAYDVGRGRNFLRLEKLTERSDLGSDIRPIKCYASSFGVMPVEAELQALEFALRVLRI